MWRPSERRSRTRATTSPAETNPPVPSDDLVLAHRLADLAADTALRLIDGASFEVRAKEDGTPVTDVDEAVEDALRALIATERPSDAVLGEERGLTGDSSRRWIIDAVDGTANLAEGSPVWGTLIALEENGELEVGLLSAPMFGRRWWAERGSGAWCTKDVASWQRAAKAMSVSERSSLRDARAAVLPDSAGVVSTGVVGSLADAFSMIEVAGQPALLVAQGELEVSVHLGGGPWDHAALAVIVTEAGGGFSDLQGQQRVDTGSVVFSNGLVHQAALGLLRQAE